MEAVKTDGWYELRFPDIDNYSEAEMAQYDAKWAEVGDVRLGAHSRPAEEHDAMMRVNQALQFFHGTRSFAHMRSSVMRTESKSCCISGMLSPACISVDPA